MIKHTLISFIVSICLPLAGIGQEALSVHITGYDVKCYGSATGRVVANASGGTAPYSYEWTPAVGSGNSANDLAAGTYMVTVRDALRHTVTETVTINDPPALIVNIDSNVVRPCFLLGGGGVCGCANTLWAVVSGGTPPYSYLWSPGDYTGDTLKHACYIEWAVQVTDANACATTESLIVVAPGGHTPVSTGINGPNEPGNISVYPNPVNNQLNISIDQPLDAQYLEVYDMKGERVLMQKLNGNEQLVTIDVSRLAEGDYLLRLAGDDAQKTTRFSISR